MPSETLFFKSNPWFNRTLYLKNMTRFWPIWVIYLVCWLFAMPLPILLQSNSSNFTINFIKYGILDIATTGSVMSAFPFGLLSAMAVFSYLYNSRSVGLIHSLPVRREGLFITNYLSGLSFMVLPLLVIFLLTLLAELLVGMVSVGTLLTWLCVQLLVCLFFYSFAVFCAMFTGHILALPAFYGILNFLAAVLAYLINTLFQELLFGFIYAPGLANFAQWLTPSMNIVDRLGLNRTFMDGTVVSATYQGLETAVLYAAVGIVFTVLALVVYRRRQLECAGDVVSISWVRPVFKYGVAFCSSMTLGSFLDSLFYSRTSGNNWFLLFFMLISGALGYFVAEMLLNKSFRIFRRSWKGCLIFSLSLAALACVIRFDLTGFEQRVPNSVQIESIRFSGVSSYPRDTANYTQVILDDPEDIALVTRLHAAIVARREDYRDDWYSHTESYTDKTPAGFNTPISVQTISGQTIHLYYTLTDGSTVERSYNIPITAQELLEPDTPSTLLSELINRSNFIDDSYGLEQYEDLRLMEATMTFFDRKTQSYAEYSLDQTQAEAEELLSAIRADLAAGRIGRRYLLDDMDRLSNCYYNDLILYFYVPETNLNSYDVKQPSTLSLTITLQTTSSETLKVLHQLGFITDETPLTTQLEVEQMTNSKEG